MRNLFFFRASSMIFRLVVLEGLPGHRVWPGVKKLGQKCVESLILRSQAMTKVAYFHRFVCFRSKGYDFEVVKCVLATTPIYVVPNFIRFVLRPFFLEICCFIFYISHSRASLTGCQRRPLCNLLQSRDFSLSEHRLKTSTKHECN